MSESLYDIFRSKCFALAYTTVIHSRLTAESQNDLLQQAGFNVNHTNPKTWRYYKNLAGEYHDYDKALISQRNPDGHPYMRIKVAGDNKPVEVDFTRELVSGATGDYTLAAEYSYGSDYYVELLSRYPDSETLILGILNPTDIDVSTTASNGDILYCGGYQRQLVPNIMKERYGFTKRADVTIDTEFLIEDWEHDVLWELQEYIKNYMRRWENPDYAYNHTYYSEAIKFGMVANLVPVIEKIRLNNFKSYSTHSFHVREFINGFGYLGQYVDALTREQQMYLYYNMDWLTTNKGKEKVLKALIDNLLTPSNIPLVAYNLGHYNWDMVVNGRLDPTVEFTKETLNLSIAPETIGINSMQMIVKESKVARDNSLYMNDQAYRVDYLSDMSAYDKLKTKVLESNFKEWDTNIFFDLTEFQWNQWLYSAYNGTYQGSIFVTQPNSGGRLQLTPKTALILFFYVYVKGYTGIELERPPKMRVRNIPKEKVVKDPELEPYPTDEMFWEHVHSYAMTQEKIESLKNFPPPVFKYTSTTDFNAQTKIMFETMEKRRGLAAAEEDMHANAEMELMVAKFYHLWIYLDPLIDTTYEEWLSLMGIDLKGLSDGSLRILAMDLYNAGMGNSESTKRSASKMHEAILNILKYFLSYTVQLVGEFYNSSSRMFGLKTLRLSLKGVEYEGMGSFMHPPLDMFNFSQDRESDISLVMGDNILLPGLKVSVGRSQFTLIDLIRNVERHSVRNTTMNFLGFSGFSPEESTGVAPISETTYITDLESCIVSEPYDDVLTFSKAEAKFSLKGVGAKVIKHTHLNGVTSNVFNIEVKKK